MLREPCGQEVCLLSVVLLPLQICTERLNSLIDGLVPAQPRGTTR